MDINITLADVVRLCIFAWWAASMFLMFAPSLSEKFKERFAGTAYGIFTMAFAFVVPLLLMVCLMLTGNLPIKEQSRPVFTVNREGVHYVWKKM